MNQDLALRVLSQLMDWSDDQARVEFRWLRFMARLKYDGYRDFVAGARFLESLATWLQQFKTADERRTAYAFVRKKLIYISPAELHRLVERFYPRVVERQLLDIVAKRHALQRYEIFRRPDLEKEVRVLRRRTLFLGLSDGARLDVFRHATIGLVSNEQVVGTTQIDLEKWTDLCEELRKDPVVNDPTATFDVVFLVDDFVGTGTGLVRWNQEKTKWSGKLEKFAKSVEAVRKEGVDPLSPQCLICIHHYLGNAEKIEEARNRAKDAQAAIELFKALPPIPLTFGMELPLGIAVTANKDADAAILAMADKYYDSALETRHTALGGTDDMRRGFGGCALPVVLEHNTPNNSLSLIWAETDGAPCQKTNDPQHAMRPLFRRKQRHS